MAERLDLSGLSHLWDSLKPFLMKGVGVFYVEGPDTDVTAGTWTGTVPGLTAYYDGLTVLYKPAVAGASETTLELNSLGAKVCYYTGSTKLTTQYSTDSVILLTYHDNGWRRADYNSNTTYSAQTAALLTAGTNTSNRTIRADVFKAALKAVITQDAGAVKVYDSAVGVALDQGAANAGKFLAVGTDGIVTPVALPAANGGSF